MPRALIIPCETPASRLIAAIADRQIEATTTVEVIQEFVHVRARRRDRTDAVILGSDYVELLSPLLTVTTEHLRRGLSLFEQVQRLGAFDAVLAAAAIDVSANALVSTDKAFVEAPDLPHVIPDVAGIATLLSK